MSENMLFFLIHEEFVIHAQVYVLEYACATVCIRVGHRRQHGNSLVFQKIISQITSLNLN